MSRWCSSSSNMAFIRRQSSVQGRWLGVSLAVFCCLASKKVEAGGNFAIATIKAVAGVGHRTWCLGTDHLPSLNHGASLFSQSRKVIGIPFQASAELHQRLQHIKMPTQKPEERGESSNSASKAALTASTNGNSSYELPWYVTRASMLVLIAH